MKETKIPSAHIALTKINVFAHPIDFFVSPILQKLQIYHAWFFFSATPSVDSYLRHFGTINK